MLAGFDPDKFDAAAISQGGVAANRYIAPGFIVDHAPFTLGNAGFTVNIRDPRARNEDISIQKGFRLGATRMQVRAEMLNAFNRRTFGGVNTNVLDARFGQITSVSGQRIGQIGIRMEF